MSCELPSADWAYVFVANIQMSDKQEDLAYGWPPGLFSGWLDDITEAAWLYQDGCCLLAQPA